MIKGTENLNIGDLISKRLPFVVQPYQRAYAWEKEQVDDFIKDIDNMLKKQILGIQGQAFQQQQSFQKHFFGGIISVETFVPQTTSGRKFDVVDGQQRLSTFTITLSLIASALDELSSIPGITPTESTIAKSYADKIRTQYLYYDELINGSFSKLQRVVLSKTDKQFFYDMIIMNTINNPTRDSHRRLASAWSNIRTSLINPILNNNLTITEKLNRLTLLRDVITDYCYIIHIISDDKTEAYQLFMVLNDRGKSLSAGDLLRAETLRLLENFTQMQINSENLWDKILRYKENDIESFLRAYYVSNINQRPGKTTLYDDFKKEFFSIGNSIPHQQEADNIYKVINNLDVEMEFYVDITSGIWPYNNSSLQQWKKDRMNRLIKILKHSLCVPLLLAGRAKLDENKFFEIISILERFVFRYVTICGEHAGKLSDIYYNHCVKIRNQGNLYNLQELINDLRTIQTQANDVIFKDKLIDKLIYTKNNRAIIAHFLTTIEDYKSWLLGQSIGPSTLNVYDLKSLEVEHIYPQNPAIKDPDLEILKHSIGNLSFWGSSDNKSASNQDFQGKKPFYVASNVSLNRDLSTLNKWDKQEVVARGNNLKDLAARLFLI